MEPLTKVTEVQKLHEDLNEIKMLLQEILRNMTVATDIKAAGSDEEDMSCCKEEHSNELSLDPKITTLLRRAGIPAHLQGYCYIREAIAMCLEDFTLTQNVTKILYPSIAKKYHTTPSRVERAIRHAVEVGWNRGDTDFLDEVFSYTISSEKGKPTNSEFIAMIVDHIRLQ